METDHRLDSPLLIMNKDSIADVAKVTGVTVALLGGIGISGIESTQSLMQARTGLRVLLTISVGATLFLIGIALETAE